MCKTEGAHAFLENTSWGAVEHHTIRDGVTGFDVCRYDTVHYGK